METLEVTMSIGDAAKELGVSVITLRRWADSGKIRSELVTDMIELITVCSARLYGSRSKKNKKLIDGMTQVVKDVS